MHDAECSLVLGIGMSHRSRPETLLLDHVDNDLLQRENTRPAAIPMHPIASSSNTRKPKKHKEKSQQHKASSPDADAHAETPMRNETLSLSAPTSAATAPAVEARRDGRVPADYDIEFGDFDFDAVKAEEGAELWLVRAPSSVRLALFLLLDKHTSRACLHPPSPLSLLMDPSAPAQFTFSFFPFHLFFDSISVCYNR